MGEENFDVGGSGNSTRFILLLSDAMPSGLGVLSVACTHFLGGPYGASETTSGACDINPYKNLRFNNSGIASTVEDWKSWVSSQYAAGTPVTVWYVLENPQTGIVNEPLMKIGDYTDTVTAANVPTTGTPENFDVGTTLKPSEVQLTYHGWHEHEDTKYMQGE